MVDKVVILVTLRPLLTEFDHVDSREVTHVCLPSVLASSSGEILFFKGFNSSRMIEIKGRTPYSGHAVVCITGVNLEAYGMYIRHRRMKEQRHLDGFCYDGSSVYSDDDSSYFRSRFEAVA